MTQLIDKDALITDPTPNERMSKERFVEACKAACSDRNYRSHYGHTETRDDYFVDGVQWTDEHPIKEPVSEDLEEAAASYAKEEYNRKNPSSLSNRCIGCYAPIMYAFKAGAQWQKEETINKACMYLNEHREGIITDEYIISFRKAIEE